PLLPAARQRACELFLTPLEPEPLHHRARRANRIGHIVEPRDELQVLAHRKVLIQAEALRHVADLALDLVALGQDVVAQTSAAPLVWREQPAQHADSRCFSGAVRPEEAVDRAAPHLHREVMHDLAPAEGLAQALDFDRDVGRGHCFTSLSATLTGWPTRKPSCFSARASTMNTSLLRSSRL